MRSTRLILGAAKTFAVVGSVLVVAHLAKLTGIVSGVTKRGQTGTICDEGTTYATDGVCWTALALPSYFIIVFILPASNTDVCDIPLIPDGTFTAYRRIAGRN